MVWSLFAHRLIVVQIGSLCESCDLDDDETLKALWGLLLPGSGQWATTPEPERSARLCNAILVSCLQRRPRPAETLTAGSPQLHSSRLWPPLQRISHGPAASGALAASSSGFEASVETRQALPKHSTTAVHSWIRSTSSRLPGQSFQKAESDLSMVLEHRGHAALPECLQEVRGNLQQCLLLGLLPGEKDRDSAREAESFGSRKDHSHMLGMHEGDRLSSLSTASQLMGEGYGHGECQADRNLSQTDLMAAGVCPVISRSSSKQAERSLTSGSEEWRTQAGSDAAPQRGSKQECMHMAIPRAVRYRSARGALAGRQVAERARAVAEQGRPRRLPMDGSVDPRARKPDRDNDTMACMDGSAEHHAHSCAYEMKPSNLQSVKGAGNAFPGLLSEEETRPEEVLMFQNGLWREIGGAAVAVSVLLNRLLAGLQRVPASEQQASSQI
jgi:hypothetical protein